MICAIYFKFYLYLNFVCLKIKFIEIDSVFDKAVDGIDAESQKFC